MIFYPTRCINSFTYASHFWFPLTIRTPFHPFSKSHPLGPRTQIVLLYVFSKCLLRTLIISQYIYLDIPPQRNSANRLRNVSFDVFSSY
ncbi:hypothetical protein PAXRUDRAFT_629881 [Paxillus rubicundulus Ve08.2h10]|uniref:Uncharacterized protein n=1 Tax=Paxillus rubicundulus Ve08.2h10 TaxID=930991 RepID=A0A0D0DSY4_9AGAM|nr:hypothetical protein PAXRUDRAFT_629881 [Paxillus rubicundulus Ve08.2h10]